MLTPGVSVSRSSNFRPRMGVFSTAVWFSVLAAAVRVTSTGGWLTVTVSDTPDTFIEAPSVTV